MTKEDAIKTLKELWRETYDPWYEEVYNMAINALEADRKIVKCAECKHWVSDGGAIMFCEHTDVPTDADDYCSWGERRE